MHDGVGECRDRRMTGWTGGRGEADWAAAYLIGRFRQVGKDD